MSLSLETDERFGKAMKKNSRMRDFREKGAGMQGRDPLFQTLVLTTYA